MAKAIVIHQPGGPDCMKWEDVEVGKPGQGEVLIKHTVVGLNYIDVYVRTGAYPLAEPPFTPGAEGAGIVEEVGPGVTELSVGDRIAYVHTPGSYSEYRVMPTERLVRIPDGISEEQAAAMMLKGMTAQYLLKRTFPVKKGHTVLFHAAAGGVGLIACQWASALGATVIGTVGSEEKAALAKANGAAHTINYREEDFVERVKEITDGAGVDVAYDAVGKDTYPGSLDCLKPLGMWVSFGMSSGPVPDLNIADLGKRGSLFATRPSLFHYVAKRDDLVTAANDLFSVVIDGTVKISIDQRYPLSEAAQSHIDLEGRKTTGATVLTI